MESWRRSASRRQSYDGEIHDIDATTIEYVVGGLGVVVCDSDEVIRFGSYLVALMAAVFVIFATANRLAILMISLRRQRNPGLDALIHISAKLMAVIVTLALLMLGGQFLGIPVTTLLASAGISGIAVALAAQDTLKNLFATLTLMADRPCSVGD